MPFPRFFNVRYISEGRAKTIYHNMQMRFRQNRSNFNQPFVFCSHYTTGAQDPSTIETSCIHVPVPIVRNLSSLPTPNSEFLFTYNAKEYISDETLLRFFDDSHCEGGVANLGPVLWSKLASFLSLSVSVYVFLYPHRLYLFFSLRV